jgi:glycosyltransferase involved in cell wall biosynthesis
MTNRPLKIAYISVTALSDCDLPLIHELSKAHDVDYYFLATNTTRQGTVININLKGEGGIFPGTIYQELSNIKKWIDLDHVYVVNKPVNHDWEWLNFKVAWKWMKMLKHKGYDIIHVTWPLRYCSMPLYLLRKKMVLTMHDPIPHSSNETLENKFHRWCCVHLTPDFILLNETQREEFLQTYGIHPSRVFQSRLSIYTHLKYTTPAPPLCDKPYLLYIGSIAPHKGIEYFCKAMIPVTADNSNVCAVVAGKGAFYFDKSQYENNPSYIFINRFITDEELASLISHCIAVVCPYIDATQSGVIMSAYALNKPVIATTVGALPEMVEDGRFGYLIPPKDVTATEKAIRRIIKPGVSQQMSEFIEKDFATGNHSWSEIAKGIHDIYREIILKREKKR